MLRHMPRSVSRARGFATLGRASAICQGASPRAPDADVGGMSLRRLLPLLVLVGLAVAAPCAQAAKGLEMGVQDDGHFLGADPGVRASAFEHAGALGATALRTNLHWAKVVSEPGGAVAPAAPAYAFAAYDRM